MHIKSFGVAPRMANARPSGGAKFANAPPPGLTRRTNTHSGRGGGGGEGADGIELMHNFSDRTVGHVDAP